jgi:hypothetical protein
VNFSFLLASLIKSVGKERAEVIVMTAFRLGWLEGQTMVLNRTETLLKEQLPEMFNAH